MVASLLHYHENTTLIWKTYFGTAPKLRGLGIPTMTDRAMQALYLLGLDPIAESQADGHSYGFRLERRCADALKQAHILLGNRHGPQWILEGDIKACFDRISHDWLLAHI